MWKVACNLCNRRFKTDNDLQAHVQNKHLQDSSRRGEVIPQDIHAALQMSIYRYLNKYNLNNYIFIYIEIIFIDLYSYLLTFVSCNVYINTPAWISDIFTERCHPIAMWGSQSSGVPQQPSGNEAALRGSSELTTKVMIGIYAYILYKYMCNMYMYKGFPLYIICCVWIYW